MFTNNSDKDWEKFGKEDPYFGVLSQEKFHGANLNDDAKEEFFNSGTSYIGEVLANVRRHIDSGFTITKALDFGCGVGRLVIPLAKMADEVTGMDVSPSMLAEAQANCDARSLGHVNLVTSDDALSQLQGTYDFIHSVIVFQHIPVARGELIFQQLLTHLADGGVGVLHFTYAKESNRQKLATFIKRAVPFSGNITNVLRGRAFSAPQMQMNAYDLNRLFAMLQQADVVNVHTEFTNHGGELGVVLYFQKPEAG